MGLVDIEFPPDWDVNKGQLVHNNEPNQIYKEYAHLRKTCPVAHVDAHNGYWILTKFVSFPTIGFNYTVEFRHADE
jgi:hypothetical protein